MRAALRSGILCAGVALSAGWLPPSAPLKPVAAASRVSALVSQDAPQYRAALEGFEAALKQSSPGTEVVVHIMTPGTDPAALAGTVRAEGPVLILALGSAAVETARQVGDVPVVAGMVLRPADVLRGPRFTGVFLEFPSDVEFHFLARILPGQRRVAVLYNAAQNQGSIDLADRSARSAGLELLARKVSAPADIPATLQSLSNHADVLWGLADTLVLTRETAGPILLFSLQNRIPFVGLSAPWVKAGAVYALERDYGDIGRQCAELAAQVLAGSAPADLPPQSPRRVLYLINRRTADQLKLTIAKDVLRGAEEVVE
jgi:putative ABC transport system substrate-binding protein